MEYHPGRHEVNNLECSDGVHADNEVHRLTHAIEVTQRP